jgi:hypothetical protein
MTPTFCQFRLRRGSAIMMKPAKAVILATLAPEKGILRLFQEIL